MSGQDRIEIWQDERTMVGAGTLHVTPGAHRQSGWPVVDVEGTVTFDDRVTTDDLWVMYEAEVRIDLADGSHHAFGFSVVIEQEPDPRVLNTYTLKLSCHVIGP